MSKDKLFHDRRWFWGSLAVTLICTMILWFQNRTGSRFNGLSMSILMIGMVAANIVVVYSDKLFHPKWLLIRLRDHDHDSKE